MNPILIDLLIAAIVLLAALRGKKRGFVLTLCGFLAIFVAFIGASVLSAALSGPVAELLRPIVENAVLTILDNRVISDLPTPPTEFSTLAVLNTLHDVPMFSGITEMFRSALESGAVRLDGSAALALAEYAAVQLSRILLFLAAFAAILILWWLLSHTLDLAFHLPGLNFLNRFGGLVLGLGQGLVLVVILCWLFRDSYITPDMVESSFFLPYFCGLKPLPYISALYS